MTEQELDGHIDKLIEAIVRAAKDIQTNPEKAEKFIRAKVKAAYEAGKSMGRQIITDELFNGEGM